MIKKFINRYWNNKYKYISNKIQLEFRQLDKEEMSYIITDLQHIRDNYK